MEAETGRGAGVARGPARPGEEGGILGKGEPVRWPGLAGLISIGKNEKGFGFRI
jgi:hypothetical protein